MALLGNGAIVIWHDIAAEGLAQYYDWHDHEHLPERLGIPGFRRGSRYIAIDGTSRPELLTLYELTSRDVATSEAYLARLNAPTDWSRSTMLHFRNMVRALTTVERSIGIGQGGIAATLRLDDTAAGQAALAAVRAAPGDLEAVTKLPRITSIHLCATDTAASAAKTAESKHRGDTIAAPNAIVIIEGCDVDAVRAGVDKLLGSIAGLRNAATVGIYRLEHALVSTASGIR